MRNRGNGNFYALRNFSVYVLYTTLEVKPVQTALFPGFSGYRVCQLLTTNVSKSIVRLVV